MFLDASALVAMIAEEQDHEALSAAVARSAVRITSALAAWEAAVALARVRAPLPLSEARTVVQRYLAAAEVEIISIGLAEHEAALDAFERFGKGRHPAKLNMGDCFSYACAKTHGAPLLFKGDDFGKTDIPAA